EIFTNLIGSSMEDEDDSAASFEDDLRGRRREIGSADRADRKLRRDIIGILWMNETVDCIASSA
ncbi:MAG TPA: hypothetical protein VGS27_16690, partial [Candidatus Sulfotelmatobacter sp.]|nr:hypothetical protein [Candidatus Sulfotelmatobacter sp.]